MEVKVLEGRGRCAEDVAPGPEAVRRRAQEHRVEGAVSEARHRHAEPEVEVCAVVHDVERRGNSSSTLTRRSVGREVVAACRIPFARCEDAVHRRGSVAPEREPLLACRGTRQDEEHHDRNAGKDRPIGELHVTTVASQQRAARPGFTEPELCSSQATAASAGRLFSNTSPPSSDRREPCRPPRTRSRGAAARAGSRSSAGSPA